MRASKFFRMLLCVQLLLAVGCYKAPSDISTNKWLHHSPLPPQGKRLYVFISDLHIGLGKIKRDSEIEHSTNGTYHPMEDFRWHSEFSLFIKAVHKEAEALGVPTELIILGDFLELWQSVEDDCQRTNRNLGCTRIEAYNRTIHCLEAHPNVLAALREFTAEGGNRVTIVPGNHDAALVFDNVAQALVSAISALEGRVRVAKEGYWLSADGLIFAEHGHQIEGDVNSFDVLPASCLTKDGDVIDCSETSEAVYLQRPWGEKFVQDYYNQFERKYPIIDNISEEGRGIRLGIGAAGIGDTGSAIIEGIYFFLFQQSWEQFFDILGKKGQSPNWDFDNIRLKGDRWLIECLPKNDPLRAKVEMLHKEGRLKLCLQNLSDEEIVTLCDYRLALIELARHNEQVPPVTPCPRKNEKLGAIKEYVFGSWDRRFQNRLNWLVERLPESGRPNRRFEVYIYGHTHKAHGIKRVFEGEEWNPAILNTGAFQRLATPKQLERIQDEKKIADEKVLLKLSPEDLPPCYSFVSIRPFNCDKGERPDPVLLYWIEDRRTKEWRLYDSCPY